MTIERLIFCFLCFTCVACEKKSSSKEAYRTIDEVAFLKALSELKVDQSEVMHFLIFPVKGCGSCSEGVIQALSAISQLTINSIYFTISGENDELSSLIKTTLHKPILVNDNQSLLVRYGIVSIYPLFVKKEMNKKLKVIEVRSESFQSDMDCLLYELAQR